MVRTIFIKNMVCNRCKMTILNLLTAEGLEVESVKLGEVIVKENQNNDYAKLEKQLRDLGFELITDNTKALVEQIKTVLVQKIESGEANLMLSELAKDIGKNYFALSKTFSKSEDITIEKYAINLKIEKVKEYIQLNELNFSEIAYSLNYKNSSHLAKQFKTITGMSMTSYRNMQKDGRRALDKIV